MVPATPLESIYITSWMTGYYPNKPLLGSGLVRGIDAAVAGSNIEFTENFIPRRRNGFSKWSTQSISLGDSPNNGFSYIDGSTVRVIIDDDGDLWEYTTTGRTSLYTKTGTAKFDMVADGNKMYAANGLGADIRIKRIANAAVKRWGIAAPTAVPTVADQAGAGVRVRIGWKYIYVYRDSTDGHISSPSPISANIKGNSGGDGIISRVTCTETTTATHGATTRVDFIDIYRTTDGGSTFFFLTSIANTHNGGTTFYDDSTPDSGLNQNIISPEPAENDPPPAGLYKIVVHNGRIFGSKSDETNALVFNLLDAEKIGGGVDEECWPASNKLRFPTAITRLASTPNGLLVFTYTDLWLVRGTFKGELEKTRVRENFSVVNDYNVAVDGSTIYVLTAQKQLLRLGDDIVDIGYPIQTDLDALTSVNSGRLVIHRQGNKSSLWLRVDQNTVLKFNITTETWSTPYDLGITVGWMGSIMTSLGNWDLLFGPSGASGFLQKNNTAVFQDDGANYLTHFTLATFQLATLGESVDLKCVFYEGSHVPGNIQYGPQSPQETALLGLFVDDPPFLETNPYIESKRWYCPLGAAVSNRCRYVTFKIEFSTSTDIDETYGFGFNFARVN